MLFAGVYFNSISVNANGVSLNQSRVIYSASDKSQMVQVHNDTDNSLLVQASILDDIEGKPIDSFIVTPPLFKVVPRSDFAMRILPNNLTSLPKDRESIFYFKVRALPSMKKVDESENRQSLVFVTAFIIKLIYRPEGIHEPRALDYKKVYLTNKNGHWEFVNPTPYYMTIVGLSIDTKTSEGSFLIKPFDSLILENKISDKSNVSWYFLNDFGAATEKYNARDK